MTTREKVDQQLRTSWDLPETVYRLQAVVQEIEECVPGERTKELMYELVELVLSYGERLHDLETRMISGSIMDDHARRNERMRVEAQKKKREGDPGTNAYHPHDPDDVKHWRG